MTDYFVHESAYVDAGATIGAGTRVWHFCHVMPGAVIGERCTLGQNVVVMSSVRIGNDVKIQNNVSVYEGVTLEDQVFCGPSCVFTNVINPRSEVSRRNEYLPTLVRRGATIGANATILCGATVGEYAFIGAGAVVRGDVAPYALMLGVVVPSKMLEIMAAARPIILGVEGEASALLMRARAGIAIEPQNAAELVAAIRLLQSNPSHARQLGVNGRAFVRSEFARGPLAARYLRLLLAVAGVESPVALQESCIEATTVRET